MKITRILLLDSRKEVERKVGKVGLALLRILCFIMMNQTLCCQHKRFALLNATL